MVVEGTHRRQSDYWKICHPADRTSHRETTFAVPFRVCSTFKTYRFFITERPAAALFKKENGPEQRQLVRAQHPKSVLRLDVTAQKDNVVSFW